MTSPVQIIQTTQAATPGGHYSQAVVHQDTIYVSGLLPIRAGSGEKVQGTMEEQLSTIFDNLDAILEAAGSSRSAVIKTTVYVADIALWSIVNEKYREYFGDHKPARAVVPVPELHFGFKVEIDAIAARIII